MGIWDIAQSISPTDSISQGLTLRATNDDQNVHVIICLSHLPNLFFKEFVFRTAKKC